MTMTSEGLSRPPLRIPNTSVVLGAAVLFAITANASIAGSDSWRDAKASATSTRSFSGVASFYGNVDEPKRETASGQRFSEDSMTAAHRTLPFGTRLRVTHGGRSVVVTINDRGPFVKGRVLDLTTGAARAIGITSAKGLGNIVAEVQ
ncbi:MAG: septal ring lytic transglycosylase RlpA family protein [Xanthobacteraceae bacterium]|nr:septal ring lytic transglycosylase RlpA family protein [Xanthobacteraceae bacterium]